MNPAGVSKPAHPHFEFGGPIGSSLITLALPFVVLLLCLLCGRDYCLEGFRFDTIGGVMTQLPDNLGDLLSPLAFEVCTQWLLLQLLLDRALPGNTVEGVALQDGSRLRYKMSGHASFWVSLLLVAVGTTNFKGMGIGGANLAALYDIYEELAVASAVLSIALSIGLYFASLRGGAKLANASGTIGLSTTYDFFIGRELNPRVGPVDLKFFCELRPGLIGWVILNLGMAAKQMELIGYVSSSMVMVNVFQGLYVWDGLFYERAILTTMDITTEGFGFMLAFGDLCWVPIVYSLQAHYLVTHDPGLPLWAIGAISCLCLLGYTIFRGANGEKDAFRKNPDDPAISHLKWMPTERGTKLLTSGWWGAARKINYTGDWIMGLSWCLFTGFRSLVPYFYCIYFGILLVHRALRDDHACAAKYGADWQAYKRKVPSIFIPGLI